VALAITASRWLIAITASMPVPSYFLQLVLQLVQAQAMAIATLR
jgi:hypothetical protein